MFKIGYDQEISNRDDRHREDVQSLTNWSIAIYEKLDASGCIVTPLPKVPLKEK